MIIPIFKNTVIDAPKIPLFSTFAISPQYMGRIVKTPPKVIPITTLLTMSNHITFDHAITKKNITFSSPRIKRRVFLPKLLTKAPEVREPKIAPKTRIEVNKLFSVFDIFCPRGLSSVPFNFTSIGDVHVTEVETTRMLNCAEIEL